MRSASLGPGGLHAMRTSDPDIDANLLYLLRQRQQMLDGHTVLDPYPNDMEASPPLFYDTSATRHRNEALDVSDEQHSASFASPKMVSPFTPDRPTMPRRAYDPGEHSTTVSGSRPTGQPPPSAGPPLSPLADSRRGAGGRRYSDPVGGSLLHDREGFSSHETHQTGLFDTSFQSVHQQRWEEDRAAGARRTDELMDALDEARQAILLRDCQVHSLRTELQDREDELERLRCQQDLMKSSYQRDRRYYLALAQATLLTCEEGERREILAREREWRMYMSLAAWKAASLLEKAGLPRSWPCPWQGAVLEEEAPPPPPPADFTPRGAGAHPHPHPHGRHCSCRESHTVLGNGDSAGRFSRNPSESRNVSPRSHGAASCRRQPLPSPSREEGGHTAGVGVGVGVTGGAGLSPSAGTMHCKANLLSEVSSAKRALEEELATLRTELQRLREASDARDHSFTERLTALSRELTEERELTADMQAELDDLILTEMLLQEALARRGVEVDAGDALVGLMTQCAAAVKVMLLQEGSQGADPPVRPGPCAGEEGDDESLAPLSIVLSDGERPAAKEGATSFAVPTTVDMEAPRTSQRKGVVFGKSALKHSLCAVMTVAATRDSGPPPQDPSGSSLLPPLSPKRASQRAPSCAAGPAQREAVDTLSPVESLFVDPDTFPLASFSGDGDSTRPCSAGRARSKSQPLSETSQGASPEHPDEYPDRPNHRDTGEDTDERFKGGGGAVPPVAVGVASVPQRVLRSPSLRLPALEEQMQFAMPHFSSSSLRLGQCAAAGTPNAHPSSTPSGSGTFPAVVSGASEKAEPAVANTDGEGSRSSSSGGCASGLSAKIPGEECFQPQALSFSALPSHVWDLVDSDDESIPTAPAAGSFAPPPNDRPLKRPPKSRTVSNPYDDDGD